MSELVDLTKRLWTKYFVGERDKILEMLHLFQENSVVIGTGKHEFHTSLEQFREAIHVELRQRGDIHFQLEDFYCDEMVLTQEVRLIYGSCHVFWRGVDQPTCIDMDCRFSILFKRVDGCWKVFHIHQSIPSADQLDGESYPWTLRQQVEQAQQQIESLTQLAETDGLTHLINYRSFQVRYENMEKHNSWLYVIDIDNFKGINDRYGHLSGNEALLNLANILSSAVRGEDLVCRMGGDEFVLLCTGLCTSRAAIALANRLLEQVRRQMKDHGTLDGISIGFTKIREEESLDSAFLRADKALYLSKTSGKNMASML